MGYLALQAGPWEARVGAGMQPLPAGDAALDGHLPPGGRPCARG